MSRLVTIYVAAVAVANVAAVVVVNVAVVVVVNVAEVAVVNVAAVALMTDQRSTRVGFVKENKKLNF